MWLSTSTLNDNTLSLREQQREVPLGLLIEMMSPVIRRRIISKIAINTEASRLNDATWTGCNAKALILGGVQGQLPEAFSEYTIQRLPLYLRIVDLIGSDLYLPERAGAHRESQLCNQRRISLNAAS